MSLRYPSLYWIKSSITQSLTEFFKNTIHATMMTSTFVGDDDDIEDDDDYNAHDDSDESNIKNHEYN